MFCTNCGKQIDDDSKFCVFCGNRIGQSQAAPTETAPVEAAPVEAAPVEAAPVETAPVEAAPVEAAPVEATPVETAPVEIAPVAPTYAEQVQPMPQMQQQVPEQLQMPEQPQPAKKKKKIWIPIVIVAGVLLLAGGGVLFWINTDGFKYGQEMKKAEGFMQSQSYDEAIESYQQALIYNPEAEDAQEALQHAYFARGEEYAAARKYDAALEDYLAAKQLMTDDKLEDALCECYLQLAQIRSEDENYAEAVTFYKEVQKLDAGNQDAFDGLLDAYVSWGNQRFDAGDYEAAIEYYNDASKMDATNQTVVEGMVSAYCAQGRIYEENSNYVDAKGLYEQAAALDEDAVKPVDCLVNLLLKEGDVLGAFEKLNDQILTGENSSYFRDKKAELLANVVVTYKYSRDAQIEEFNEYDEDRIVSYIQYIEGNCASTTQYEYNDDGYLTRAEYMNGTMGYGTSYRTIWYSGDEAQECTSETYSFYDENDVMRNYEECRYENDQLVQSTEYSYDEEGNEISRYEISAKYNAQGLITEQNVYSSYDYGDGEAGESYTDSYFEYDRSAHLIREDYYGYDEEHNEETYHSVYEYTYDSDGNRTSYTYAYYEGGSDTPAEQTVEYYDYKFDAYGNVLYEEDYRVNADNEVYYFQSREYTYDENQNEIEEIYMYQAVYDEVFDCAYTETTWSYDESGRELSCDYWSYQLAEDAEGEFAVGMDVMDIIELDFFYTYKKEYDALGRMTMFENDSEQIFYEYNALDDCVYDSSMGEFEYEYAYVGELE